METVDIHSTATGPVEPKPPWYESDAVKGFNAITTPLRWLVMLLALGFAGYMYQRDTNVASAAAIAEIKQDMAGVKTSISEGRASRDKQIEELKRVMLTQQVFEAYHTADSQRMDRIEAMLNRLLEQRP